MIVSSSSNVCFKGIVDRKYLFGKLPEYDLGLSYIPSGIYETAPALKTLEYLACGLPVLATNTHGNRMFVKQGINGFLADESLFAQQIVEIVSQVELPEIRQNARVSVASFDWKKIVNERLLPVYRNLLEKR